MLKYLFYMILTLVNCYDFRIRPLGVPMDPVDNYCVELCPLLSSSGKMIFSTLLSIKQ